MEAVTALVAEKSRLETAISAGQAQLTTMGLGQLDALVDAQGFPVSFRYAVIPMSPLQKNVNLYRPHGGVTDVINPCCDAIYP